MEATILRQLLTASGAFKPADVAGTLRADMFIETLADAVAKGGGIGIARMLEDEIKAGRVREVRRKTRRNRRPPDLAMSTDVPDDDPASFAARKLANGTTVAHTNAPRRCAPCLTGAGKVWGKRHLQWSCSSGTDAYQKRAEDMGVGEASGTPHRRCTMKINETKPVTDVEELYRLIRPRRLLETGHRRQLTRCRPRDGDEQSIDRRWPRGATAGSGSASSRRTCHPDPSRVADEILQDAEIDARLQALIKH